MARLSVTAIAFLFLFFVTSHAQTASNAPADDAIDREAVQTLLDSHIGDTLRLPSEALDKSRGEAVGSEEFTPESKDVTVHAVPLKVVRFRPINRHFRRGSRFPIRPCRHHQKFFLRDLRPMRQRVVPYGNDMILNSGENTDFDQTMFTTDLTNAMPEDRMRFYYHHHHRHDQAGEVNDVDEKMARLGMKSYDETFGKKKRKRHFRRREDDDSDSDSDSDDEEEKKEKPMKRVKKSRKEGVMHRIRKFLNIF